jgi:uncharacterized protein (DUF58 family)
MRTRALRWRLIRRMPGLAQGEFLSSARGTGFDLVNLSPYQPGDDVRRIDWHATARSGELQVRHLLEDRDLSCWLVVDLSASQDGGLGASNKRAQALDTASLIIESIGQRGNRIGLWIDDGRDRAAIQLPARAGRRHGLRAIEQLRSHRAPPVGPQSDLARLFAQVGASVRRRSLMIVLSDFVSQDPAASHWKSRLAALAARHDLIAIQLEDPSEWTLPESGHFVVQDAETGEQLWIDADDSAFRARYQAALQSERDAVHEALQASGARWFSLHPSQDALEALARCLRQPVRRRVA